MQIVFIHGACATPTSFNYIEPQLDNRFERSYLKYDSENGFYNNLYQIVKRTQYEDIFFVSHSLGGLYALHLADHFADVVRGSVSISSPFNGSDSAVMLNMIKPCQLYRDISPYSYMVNNSNKLKIRCPWTQIVTVGGGSHLINTENDGVVTKKSMTHRSDMDFIEVDSGHYEIMLRKETVDIINYKLSLVA
jgi:predicted alpha/beta hydrolase family esterase